MNNQPRIEPIEIRIGDMVLLVGAVRTSKHTALFCVINMCACAHLSINPDDVDYNKSHIRQALEGSCRLSMLPPYGAERDAFFDELYNVYRLAIDDLNA